MSLVFLLVGQQVTHAAVEAGQAGPEAPGMRPRGGAALPAPGRWDPDLGARPLQPRWGRGAASGV